MILLQGTSIAWIKTYFIGNDASVISLLSRNELYLEQTPQESIEVTQLHIHIVKVLLKCVVILEYHNDYDSNRLESLVRILLTCVHKIDLKNFHMLGKFTLCSWKLPSESFQCRFRFRFNFMIVILIHR